MDLLNKVTGGSSEGDKGNKDQKSSGGGGGFLDKLNAKAGGGRESEKDEDMLDKGKYCSITYWMDPGQHLRATADGMRFTLWLSQILTSHISRRRPCSRKSSWPRPAGVSPISLAELPRGFKLMPLKQRVCCGTSKG